MKSEKRESTYAILSKIIKLKFGNQLKESGIEFNHIYKMTNLVTEKEHYLITVNETELRFVTSRDFISHFSRFLISNIKAQKIRYNELININTNEFTDDIGIEMSYKQIEYYIMKQTELLELMNKFKSDLSK